jgi:hypothetical protein
MPPAAATAVATNFRTGVARLADWLDDHPAIPIAYIHYADESGAELCTPAGLFEAFTVIADVADALTHATIDVTDPDHKRVTYLTVTGTVADRAGAPLEITVEGSVYDSARTALLASLGAPPVREVRTWRVTPQHLRDLAKTRCS